MIRRYCDRCGNEIGRSRAHNRIKRELFETGKIVTVEIQVAYNRTWNSGDICTVCVLLAVTTGTDISENSSITYANTRTSPNSPA